MRTLVILGASLWLAACAADVSSEAIERAEHEPYDDEPQVALTAQALGASVPLYKVCDGFCGGPIAFDAPIASVVTPAGNIMTVEVEQEVAISYAVGTGISALTAASNGAIYYARGTTSGEGSIMELGFFADTEIGETEGTVAGLATDANNVYFVDDRGLMSRARSGNGNTTTINALATILLGIDGSTLYFLRQINDGPEWQLRKTSTTGTSSTLLQPGTFKWGFSQDATNIYWIEGGPPYLIRRMNKITTTATTIRNTPSILYSTAAKANVVYWSERPTLASNMSIMKRATDGIVSSQKTGIYYVPNLLIDGDFLYWLNISTQGSDTWLKRAPL